MCYILTNAFNRDHYCHIAKEIKNSLIIICFYKLGSQQFAKHFRIANVNPSRSERETQILYINAYIYIESRKMVTWSYMQGSKRDKDVKNRLLDSVGEGEGGMIWENSIETGILPYIKQMTSPSSMHEARHSSWCSGTTQRDAVGREMGWGTHVHLWLIHVNVWQTPSQFCKVPSNIIPSN